MAKIKYKKRGINDASLKNLKPIKKGEIRNPKGRPTKENTLTSLLKDEMEKKPDLKNKDGSKNTKTWAQLLAEALPAASYKGLLKGDVRPYALLIERVDGKVAQPIIGDIKLSPKPVSQWSDDEIDNALRSIVEIVQKRGVLPEETLQITDGEVKP